MIDAEPVGATQDIRSTSATAEVSLLDLVIVLAQRRRLIFLFTLVASLLATVIAFLLPNRYTATTILLPPNQSSSMSSALMGQLNNMGALGTIAGGSLGIKSPGDMYVGLLRSRSVEEALIRHFDLLATYKEKTMSGARKSLESKTTIASGLKDGLISISVEDRDPQHASDIANGYVEELRKLNAALAITEASQRRMFFEQQLLDAKNNLAGAEQALTRTEQATGLVQLDSQTRSLIESASALRAQIVAKEVTIQGMRTFATDGNPELATARQQLAELQNQLAKLDSAQQVNGSDLMLSKGKTPEAGMEYIRKLRDVKYYEVIFDLMARQFEAAKVDEARQGTTIQVVDPAVKPDKKSYPHRAILVILSATLAFLFGATGVLLWEAFANAMKLQENRSQVEALLKVLGRKRAGS